MIVIKILETTTTTGVGNITLAKLGFSAENAGRNAHIHLTNKYRIDMSGKKSGNYEVRVPLFDADFSVELI